MRHKSLLYSLSGYGYYLKPSYRVDGEMAEGNEER